MIPATYKRDAYPAEEMAGVSLSRKHEPGELGARGKFLGKPLPHGGAFLEPPAEIDPSRRIAWLVDAASRHLGTFREAGARICKFHLDVFY
jgi:hypothetical protein